MSRPISGAVSQGMFTFGDRVAAATLTQRANKGRVIASNVANAETPGYRALGYDFEKQLQRVTNLEESLPLKVSHPRHMRQAFVGGDGSVSAEVFVRPSESLGQDGNTVDVDQEMADMAQNDILFRTAVDLINRKVGILKYSINGGR